MDGGWDLGHNTTQRGPKGGLVIRGDLVEQGLWLKKFMQACDQYFCNPAEARGYRSNSHIKVEQK